MPLDPKSIAAHPNDAAVYEQPGRISIDTDWTDSLRSRYVCSYICLCCPHRTGFDVALFLRERFRGAGPTLLRRALETRLAPGVFVFAVKPPGWTARICILCHARVMCTHQYKQYIFGGMVGTHVTLALATAFRAKHTFAKFAQCPAVAASGKFPKNNPLK